MGPVNKWALYYDDGTRFTDEDGSPAEAPARGVQVIAESDPDVGRRLHLRADFYLYLGDRWISVDIHGLIDHLADVMGLVKVGRMLSRPDFLEIYERAIADDHLPKKSGYVPGEVKSP